MDRYKVQKFVDNIKPVCAIFSSTPKGCLPRPEDLLSSHNTNFCREFFYFCCVEFSVENLMCFMAISDYRKNPTFEKATFIRQTFLGNQSPYELNTNRKNIEAVDQRLNYYSGMHVYAKTPHADIFDRIQADAAANVTDTMGRFSAEFLRTKLGVQWLYKVPLETYIQQIPKHVGLLRSMKSTGFKMPSTLNT